MRRQTVHVQFSRDMRISIFKTLHVYYLAEFPVNMPEDRVSYYSTRIAISVEKHLFQFSCYCVYPKYVYTLTGSNTLSGETTFKTDLPLFEKGSTLKGKS